MACCDRKPCEVIEPAAGEQLPKATPRSSFPRSVFHLTGLSCADCARHIETAVRQVPGVKTCQVNFGASRLLVDYEGEIPTGAILQAVKSAGFGARWEGRSEVECPRSFRERYGLHVLSGLSGALIAVGFFLSRVTSNDLTSKAFYLTAILVGGAPIFRSACVQALRHKSIGMDFLMSLAVIGGMAIGEWTEAATVIFLFSIAHLLESFSMERARRAIRSLMELSPQEALVTRACEGGQGAERICVPVEEVEVGELVFVRPGEKVPLDGIVVSGSSTVDQSPITGESMPVEVGVGDTVFAGTINQQGSLEVEVTKPFQESTFAHILHTIEEAQAERAPSQRFIDRFARYYTPCVIVMAVLVATVPPLTGLGGGAFREWVYKALVLLVISCPCALVISTPVAIVSGLASAARNGVLIKGGLYLERVGMAKVIAFDKTGTLTSGQPEVRDVIPLNGTSGDHLLGVAAAVEYHSEHPFAQAICRRAAEEQVSLPAARDFSAMTGLGARASIVASEKESVAEGCASSVHYVGSGRMFRDLGLMDEQTEKLLGTRHDAGGAEACGTSTVFVGTDSKIEGLITLSDSVRKESRSTVGRLRQSGVKHIVILTGDNAAAAEAVGKQLEVDNLHASLLPEDKVRVVRQLAQEKGLVVMVGDGINDAPALAAATVGIAMGAAGTDVALETADIALMGDDLSKLPFTIELSRRTAQIIKQNILFALTLKVVFVALTFVGFTTLWMAVGADMGASLLVIANSMRLQRNMRQC